MSNSFSRVFVHITFSTKYRFPYINEKIENELHNYIGGVCRNLECYPVIVGGYKDHIHILCVLSRNIAQKTLIEKIKTSSSKWIKTKVANFDKFYWQTGYGIFSALHRALPYAKRCRPYGAKLFFPNFTPNS